MISVQPQPRPRQVEIAIGARLYASTRPRMQVRNQIRDFAFDNSDDNELTPFVLLITAAPAG